jgi:hypothetical protein
METLSQVLLYQDTVKRIKVLKNEINNFVRFSEQMKKFLVFTNDIDLPVVKRKYEGVVSFFNFVTVDGILYLCLNLFADKRGIVRRVDAINSSLKLCEIDGKRNIRTMGNKRITSIRNVRNMRGTEVTFVDSDVIFNKRSEREIRLLENSFEKIGSEEKTKSRFVDLGLQTIS